MDKEETTDSEQQTYVTAALVLGDLDLDDFAELKRRALAFGARIFYQRTAPRGVRLWIVEKGAREAVA